MMGNKYTDYGEHSLSADPVELHRDSLPCPALRTQLELHQAAFHVEHRPPRTIEPCPPLIRHSAHHAA